MRSHYDGLKYLNRELIDSLPNEELEVYFSLYTLLYADDTVILAESAEELQKALDALEQYCHLWHMQVNIDKSKILFFSRGKVRNFPRFTLGAYELEVVQEFVYLGVTFNFNNSFTKAVNKQLFQAKKSTFLSVL